MCVVPIFVSGFPGVSSMTLTSPHFAVNSTFNTFNLTFCSFDLRGYGHFPRASQYAFTIKDDSSLMTASWLAATERCSSA